jgi:hypothetical protein
LVGSGPEEPKAREVAAVLGVRDRLEIIPWQSPLVLAEIYRHAHVVLVPSMPTATWTEQFGRVIVEAQASGAVIAGYATGSIPEVGGDPALLVEGGDVSALSSAVRGLAHDPEQYAVRRSRGVSLSSSRTWAAVASSQLELYERVVSGAFDRAALSRSPRLRRAAARAEFGETAPTTAGRRPFALPLLRLGNPISAVLARMIDTGAELKAHLSSSHRARKIRS